MTADPRLDELAGLTARLLAIPYCPWTPSPKQAKFLLDFSLEAMFGGAAGPGKSVAMLMAALQFVHVPGYSALLLRKSFADLAMPGALMDLAKDWLGGKVRWDEPTHAFTFPTGAKLVFGYLERANDRFKYQGAAFQFVGFDELTQHREVDYRYLFSRVRRPKSIGPGDALGRVPLRIRATANPGGVGHEWVKRRFIDLGPAHGRKFYPAKLEDNPYLDVEEYERSLAELDPVTRRQLREGDWGAKPEGGIFKQAWFDAPADGRPRYLDADELPANLAVVRRWDLAATEQRATSDDPDWTAGCKLGRDPKSGLWYVLDVVRFRESPEGVERKIAEVAARDGAKVPVWFEQEPGASGKKVISFYSRHILPGHTVKGEHSSGDKVTRAGPVASRAERGELWLVRGPWVGDFLDELTEFPMGGHDDQVDALSGAFHVLANAPVVPTVAPVSLESASNWLV